MEFQEFDKIARLSRNCVVKGTKMAENFKGKVALCGKGTIGLITEAEPKKIVYGAGPRCAEFMPGTHSSLCDCETGVAYVGVHLTDAIAPMGSPWSSRNPIIVGELQVNFDPTILLLISALKLGKCPTIGQIVGSMQKTADNSCPICQSTDRAVRHPRQWRDPGAGLFCTSAWHNQRAARLIQKVKTAVTGNPEKR